MGVGQCGTQCNRIVNSGITINNQFTNGTDNKILLSLRLVVSRPSFVKIRYKVLRKFAATVFGCLFWLNSDLSKLYFSEAFLPNSNGFYFASLYFDGESKQ